MRVVQAGREICGHPGDTDDWLLRIVLEERSPLRVELEAAAAEGGMIYRVQKSVPLSTPLTPECVADRVLYWTEDVNSKEILLQRVGGQTAALIRLDQGSLGHLTIEVATRELKAARAIAEEFATRFRRNQEPEQSTVTCVSFWRDSTPQPESNERLVQAVRWEDISANYGAVTAGKIALSIAATPANLESGRLILWHGKPGTGKTYALRALAHEWRAWCDIHYITDPEALLGRAGYLLHVLLHESSDERRWRLLVMEDTGELLSIDARQNVGQALSRLLNTTEGLIGQGLRVLFLITTNEELGKLNPAVTRSGRCLSATEFAPLTREEARNWLRHFGFETEPQSPLTLSELYAIIRGAPRTTSGASVGFLRVRD
jgi:hypothetical protein